MKDFQKRIDDMVSKILKEEIDAKSKEMSEKLHGNQHKLDVAEPKGKLTKADFKKLGDMGEQETEEGNAFSGALAFAKKHGEGSFEVDGKKYQVKEIEEDMGDYEGDPEEEAQAEELSAQEPTYVGRGLKGKSHTAFADINGFDNLTIGEGKKKEDTKDEKWIQKTDMKKGALRNKLGVPEGEKIPKSKLNSLKKELMKKGEGDKKLSVSDSKLLKQVNLALTLGGIKEGKNSLRLTEDELVDMIEKIILEQNAKEDKKMGKVTNSFKMKTPVGLAEVEKANKGTGKDNNDEVAKVTKKLKEYLKDGSKEAFTMEPKHFPKGNGEMAEMKKKAYKASDAVKQYVDNFAYPGLENTHYDEIKPNDEWLTKNLEGSSETGNNTEWANAVDTGLGKKVNEKRKKNMYQKEKQKSYNRVAQPIETAGEHEGEKSLDKMFAKLESTEDKKQKLISEDMVKMKHMINYNRKTQ